MNEEDFWIDDCFRVEQSRWGTWQSYLKDGTAVILSLTKNQCIHATRWYLKGKQEGFSEPVKTHNGIVGGKL